MACIVVASMLPLFPVLLTVHTPHCDATSATVRAASVVLKLIAISIAEFDASDIEREHERQYKSEFRRRYAVAIAGEAAQDRWRICWGAHHHLRLVHQYGSFLKIAVDIKS